MLKAILPATNHKPDWVELQLDGVHMARIWSHAVELTLQNTLRQFMLTISGENDVIEAFFWVDAVQPAPEPTDGR